MSQESVRLGYDPDLYVDRKSDSASDAREHVFSIARHMQQNHDSNVRRTTIITGEVGLGKTWMLKHLTRELQSEFHFITVYLDLAQYADDPTLGFMNLLQDFARSLYKQGDRTASLEKAPLQGIDQTDLSRQLMERTTDILQRHYLAICLDSVFEARWEFLEQLEEYLLGPLAINPRVLIVMAGRGKPYVWITPELRLHAAFIQLPPFSPEETRTQIQLQESSVIDRSDDIFEGSGGIPFTNYLLAKSIVNSGQLDPTSAVEAILTAVPGDSEIRDRVREYLEALCVLQVFDDHRIAPMLAAYHDDVTMFDWNLRRSSEVRQVLVRYAFARWDNQLHGYTIDEKIRHLLESSLRFQTGGDERWERLHQAAARLYRQWMDDYSNATERWAEQEQYHRAKLEGVVFHVDAERENVV